MEVRCGSQYERLPARSPHQPAGSEDMLERFECVLLGDTCLPPNTTHQESSKFYKSQNSDQNTDDPSNDTCYAICVEASIFVVAAEYTDGTR